MLVTKLKIPKMPFIKFQANATNFVRKKIHFDCGVRVLFIIKRRKGVPEKILRRNTWAIK